VYLQHLTVLLCSQVLLPSTAMAAEHCFYDSGTYGSLTVTASGSGCGTFLSYGGIYGLWQGDADLTETCTFSFSHPVDVSTLEVLMTAHTNIPDYAETAYFSLDGEAYVVLPEDIDNSYPSGGSLLIALSDGGVSSDWDDGRGTITFSAISDAVAELEIDHEIVLGSTFGSIYLICLDDTEVREDTGSPTEDADADADADTDMDTDTGETDTDTGDTDTGEADSDTDTDTDTDTGSDSGTDPADTASGDKKGCGCATSSGAERTGLGWMVLFVGWCMSRRRWS
jgi:hypothetical protein